MNSTSNNVELSDESKMEVFRHSLYIIQGFAILITNGLIVATIVRHSALRIMKEYTILGALALADAMHGLGTLMAGIYRIPLWLSHQEMVPASSRFCLLTVHNILWAWFDPGQHIMLTIVSVDRVLSVAKPLKYLSFRRTYALAIVSIAYGIALVVAIAIYVLNWSNDKPIYTKICWSSYAWGVEVSELVNLVLSTAAFSSVVIYAAIPYLYMKHNTQVNNGGITQNNNNMKFQKQLNKSVAISCAFTFVFVCCPAIGGQAARNFSQNIEQLEQVIVWIAIFGNINPMVNLFVYIHKQHYFKIAFKALFKNKTLAPNLENWPKPGAKPKPKPKPKP